MRKRANLFLIVGAVLARQALFPFSSLAAESVDSQEQVHQAGENQWIPSLAITSGVNIQVQRGSVDSIIYRGGSPTPESLRGEFEREDTAVSPFFGGSLELMAPALPVPSRPRLFVSGELIPTFAANRTLALQGIPDCVRGPEPSAPCARDEDGTTRLQPGFSADAINGAGSFTKAQINTLVYGATLGVSFPLEFQERALRVKPSIAWISYEVDAEGLVVDGECGSFLNQSGVPEERCTATRASSQPGAAAFPGFLREVTLSGSASRRFNGVGPGLDVEMDTGRYGPLGISLFLGVRAYYFPGVRTISFDSNAQSFDDMLGADTAEAQFEVEVESWMFRTHLGMRFQWLGSGE